MPIFSDTPKVVNLSSATDKGTTNLVRSLGVAKVSSLMKFVADVETDLDFDCVIKFWNADFTVQSGTISFAIGERKIISFEDWVFCGINDYFYVTIEVIDWKGNTDIVLTIYSSMLDKEYNRLLMNENGTVLYSKPAHDTGMIIDLIDSEQILDDQYNEYSDVLERRVIQAHTIREKVDHGYPRAFIDGDFRVFNDQGDSMQVTQFEWDSYGDYDTIDVSYNVGTNDITCTTLLGSDTEQYVGPQMYDFTITSGGDEQRIKVWADFEKSSDPGPISIGSISTVVVKKFLKGSVTEWAGLDSVVRAPTLFNHYRPVEKSMYSETLSFVWNIGMNRWEATLTYAAVVDKNYCLLKASEVPVPDDLWDFDGDQLIYMDNVDYDSSAVYEFEYRLDIHIVHEVDLTAFIGLSEMYMLPFTDIFRKRLSSVAEIDFEENVAFNNIGSGVLRYFSNENTDDVSIRRIRGVTEVLLPPSAVLELDENIIRIDSSYFSTDSTYIVRYKGVVAMPSSVASVDATYRYQKEDLSWSAWIDWDGRSLVPWKYFDVTVKQVQKIQLRADIFTEDDTVFVRDGGVIVLSLRAGELD